MFSYRSTPTVAALTLWAVLCANAVSGCGSVGPSHRTEQSAPGILYPGTECEPGLVFECEPRCMQGDMGACEVAGIGYLDGTVVSPDLERARILLDRACTAGRALACSAWAKMSQDDQGVSLTPAREEVLLKLGCDRGDFNACYRVGRLRLARALRDDVAAQQARDDSESAHSLFRRACDGGEVNACFELGLSASSGRANYTKDLGASARWLNQACGGDIGTACYEVARLQAVTGSSLSDPVRARQNMDKACGLGSGAACAWLGQAYEEGRGVTKNIARARDLHEAACKLEQSASCRSLGNLVLQSDPAAALAWFGQACGAGLGDACLQEGKLLEGRAPGVKTDSEAALERYEAACKGSLAQGCGYAAVLRIKLAGEEARLGRDELSQLANWLQRGCDEARLDDACLRLGDWVARGHAGLKQDGAKAALLLGPLCAQADSDPSFASACWRLGRLSEAGTGMTRNVAGAATFYDKGCVAGYDEACLSHATLLWKGSGGNKRQPEKAVAVFKRQCAQKHTSACLSLGYAQQTGVGTARNLAQAKAHFERACDQGIQAGCAYLGQYYLTTRGTERDRETGHQLLRSACDSANGEGCLFLAELETSSSTRKQELLQRACVLDVTDACLALEARR